MRESDPQVLRLASGRGWRHWKTRGLRRHHADCAQRHEIRMGKVVFLPQFSRVNRWRHEHARRRYRQNQRSDEADVLTRVSTGLPMEPARRDRRWRDGGQQQRERHTGAKASAESAV